MHDNNTPSSPLSGWTKLYHPRGPLVTLPVPIDPVAALAHVSAALDAGWLVTAPGLEPGEERDMIGWICRRVKTNQDGSESHVLDLYADNEQLKHRKLTTYLDNEDDVADFLYASGLPSIEALPLFPATAPAERGKSSQTDKFIVRMKNPIEFVYAPNPKYDADTAAAHKAKGEVYAVPRFKFSRWGRVRPGSGPSTPSTGTGSTPSTGATSSGTMPPPPSQSTQCPTQPAISAELQRVGGSWNWALRIIDKRFGTKHETARSSWENITTEQLIWLYGHVRAIPAAERSTPTIGAKLTPEQAAAEYERQMKLVEQASTPADYAELRRAYARLVPSLNERQQRDLIEYIDAAERSTSGARR